MACEATAATIDKPYWEPPSACRVDGHQGLRGARAARSTQVAGAAFRGSRVPCTGQVKVSPHEPASDARAVETAIAQVLLAERAAREAIAAAHAQAARIAEASRAELRAAAERTQSRIARLRAACTRRADAEVAALRAQADRLAQPLQPRDDDAARVEAAVARLAARLTGGPS